MIDIEGLEHRYPDGTLALKGINLKINAGELLVIAGANGSGKTTLIRHFNGLLKPSAGSVRVNGCDVQENLRKVRQWVGMVFQEADSQIVGETVAEDVAFGPENLGLPRAEVALRVAAALEALGLQNIAGKPCHLLSGGEKRRLAIAGVLAMRPQVIAFDEPFANLDYAGVRQFLRELLDFHQQGHTIVITTHDLDKIIAHADRIVVLHQGELKAEGAPRGLLAILPVLGIRRPGCAIPGSEMISWLTD